MAATKYNEINSIITYSINHKHWRNMNDILWKGPKKNKARTMEKIELDSLFEDYLSHLSINNLSDLILVMAGKREEIPVELHVIHHIGCKDVKSFALITDATVFIRSFNFQRPNTCYNMLTEEKQYEIFPESRSVLCQSPYLKAYNFKYIVFNSDSDPTTSWLTGLTNSDLYKNSLQLKLSPRLQRKFKQAIAATRFSTYKELTDLIRCNKGRLHWRKVGTSMKGTYNLEKNILTVVPDNWVNTDK